MRIIQSYWACNSPDLINNQPNWLSPEYNLMSWALSCLQLKKHYKDVYLYADNITAKILIDVLDLPYSEVFCELDVLNKYNPELWALPKIHVYSKQTEPFLHVDGDVFIWDSFHDKLMNSDLIAQNLEIATTYYDSIMESLEKNLTYFPQEILNERKNKTPVFAYNAGIFGGSDTDFFNLYAAKAYEFVHKNLSSLSKIKVECFNIFFEQYLFYCLTKEHGKEVSVLLPQIIGDNEYKGFGDFVEVPHNKQYLHLLGNYKRSEHVCLQLANRLREDYPEYYYKIISLYKNAGRPLLYDYYHFFDSNKEYSLIERQRDLKYQYQNDLLKVKTKPSKLTSETEFKDLTNISSLMKMDLDEFYKSLDSIRRIKFRDLSKDYLYARDLNVIQYFEYLFADSTKTNSKWLIAENHIQKVISKYDWSDINNPLFNTAKINTLPDTIYTLVIPECDLRGYSLSTADQLDLEILTFLKKKKDISSLFDYCRELFHSEELENSDEEFKLLITGRIKKGIYTKTIKPVFL